MRSSRRTSSKASSAAASSRPRSSPYKTREYAEPIASTLASSRSSSELEAAGRKTTNRNKTTTICFIWRVVFHPGRGFFWHGAAAARSGSPLLAPHPLQNAAREPAAGSSAGPARDANNAGHDRGRPEPRAAPAHHREVQPGHGHGGHPARH